VSLVTVLSLNIWNREGPYDDRLALIRRGIGALKPDIIGLQEVIVDASLGIDQAASIADGFGYHVSFGEASRYPNGGQFGNAILSKYPLKGAVTHPLPSPGTSPRSVHIARAESPLGSIPFAVTHFAWQFHEGAIREAQAIAAAKFVREFEKDGDLPSVLCGDLNTRPDAAEIRFLTGLQSLEGTSTHFTDTFERAGTGPGFTFDPTRNPHAALTFEAPRRIDFVLVRTPDGKGRGVPVASRVVMDEVHQRSDGTSYAASDHYGVFSVIRYA
jgi:endonuclease/exonuclease/phosphatase family metal-dependent hydrolase